MTRKEELQAMANCLDAIEIEKAIEHTKVYKDVLKHRKDCIKAKQHLFCIECFGNGLKSFTTQVIFELTNNCALCKELQKQIYERCKEK